MIFVLLSIILLLVGVIVSLLADIRRARTLHHQNLNLLRSMIKRLLAKQHLQDDQLKLSDDFRNKASLLQATLNRDIHSLIQDLTKILSQNNLLDK